MLILIRWHETGGLFQTSGGLTVFKTLEELEKSYLPFVHNSPKGVKEDIQLFVSKIYF